MIGDKLYRCGCVGSSNYCPMHGEPVDNTKRLVRCRFCKGLGRTQESMHEDFCPKCKGTGYIVKEKK